MPGVSRAVWMLGLTVVSACGQETTPVVDTAADVAAVNAVREAETAAISSGDASGSFLAADAVMMPPGEPAVIGIDAIRTWIGGFVSQFTATVNYTRHDITVSGDWAFEHYAGAMTLTPTAGGDPITETIKGIHVYRREADGTWKMVYDVWNSDTPAAHM